MSDKTFSSVNLATESNKELPIWKQKNFYHVNYFGCIILLIFTSIIACSNTLGHTMKEMGMEHIGFYEVATLHYGGSFFCLFSSQIIQELGLRKAMFINIGARLIWQLCLVPAAYRYYLMQNGIEVTSPFLSKQFLSVIQIVSALISGLGLALNWTLLGYYVNLCGDQNNRGRFHAITFQYYTAGYLCALYFSGFVADRFGLFALYCLIPMVTVLAGIVSLGLPIPEPTKNTDS